MPKKCKSGPNVGQEESSLCQEVKEHDWSDGDKGSFESCETQEKWDNCTQQAIFFCDRREVDS